MLRRKPQHAWVPASDPSNEGVPMLHVPRSPALVALTAVAAAGLVLAAAAPASAAPIDRITFSDQETLCDVDVTATGSLVIKDIERPDGTILTVVSARTTYTNEETGRTIVVTNAGPVVQTFTDNPDGTVTLTVLHRGLPEKISGEHGTLLRDAGQVLETIVFDPETDDEVSYDLQVIAGPHPDAASDFTLFCEAIGGALT
jgi:hypothetical protein